MNVSDKFPYGLFGTFHEVKCMQAKINCKANSKVNLEYFIIKLSVFKIHKAAAAAAQVRRSDSDIASLPQSKLIHVNAKHHNANPGTGLAVREHASHKCGRAQEDDDMGTMHASALQG